MYKKVLTIAIAMFLTIPMFLQAASAATQPVPVPNRKDFYYATIGEPETVDPGWAYDTASGEMIWNVYDQLIGFKREEHTEFEGHIAEAWDISPNGLNYTFKIRSGIPFQPYKGAFAYGTVTAQDVEYSIERGIVLDHEGGPFWMLSQPLMGVMTVGKSFSIANNTVAATVATKIQNSVLTFTNGTGNYVRFVLAMPYTPFLQILAQTWSSVMPAQWGADLYFAEGRENMWPGWGQVGGPKKVTNMNVDWRLFNDRYSPMARAPLDQPSDLMLGSGPYKFDTWHHGDYYRLVKFDTFGGASGYGGWPAKGVADWVDTVTVEYVAAYATRKVIFLSDDPAKQADIVDVPRQNKADMEAEYPRVRGIKNLKTLIAGAFFMNLQVGPGSQYRPKLGTSYKDNLFSDINLRKAFTYVLDHAKYLAQAWKGEAVQTANCIIDGLAEYWAGAPKHSNSSLLAAYYFKMAWGGVDHAPGSFDHTQVTPGDAWNLGFSVPLIYNEGNTPRRVAMEMMAAEITRVYNIYSAPGTVSVAATPLPWATILPAMYEYQLPDWNIGWLADFSYAHNWVTPFMHTLGDYSLFQSVQYGQSGRMQKNWNLTDGDYIVTGVKKHYTDYGDPTKVINNTYVDTVIELAVQEPDNVLGPNGVNSISYKMYQELQEIWAAEANTMMTYHQLARHWERSWVQGWFYNKLGMGSLGNYYYYLWKGIDANTESSNPNVDTPDAGVMSAALNTYDPRADIAPVSDAGEPTTTNGDDFFYSPAGGYYLIRGSDGVINAQDIGLLTGSYYDYPV